MMNATDLKECPAENGRPEIDSGKIMETVF